MSVTPTTSTAAQIISSAAASYIQNTTGSSNAANGTSTALQEAMETPEQTAQEAAKGDPQAKLLLAKEQQEKQLENPTPAKEPGKGELLDEKA